MSHTYTATAANVPLGTPTLGLYQPRALRAVAPPLLLPGLKGVVDFTLSTRVPVRVALPRRVRRSLGGAGAPHSPYRRARAPRRHRPYP